MADNNAAASLVTQDRAAFTQSIKTSLASARAKVTRIRRTDTQLFITNIVSPAAATLVSGLAATVGGNVMFKQAAAQAEDGGWVLACALVAVFGFIATVSGLFKKQVEDRLTQANQCVGRLLALDLGLTSGSIAWEQAAKEYADVIKSFPELVS